MRERERDFAIVLPDHEHLLFISMYTILFGSVCCCFIRIVVISALGSSSTDSLDRSMFFSDFVDGRGLDFGSGGCGCANSFWMSGVGVASSGNCDDCVFVFSCADTNFNNRVAIAMSGMSSFPASADECNL